MYGFSLNDEISRMEKRSIHFSVVYPAQHERYAHMLLQIAEEEYLRAASYTAQEAVRPITIYVYDPLQESGRAALRYRHRAGTFVSIQENSCVLPVDGNYRTVRQKLAETIAGILIRQSSRYSNSGETKLHSERIRHRHGSIEAYCRYIATGFTESMRADLRRYLASTRMLALPLHYDKKEQYRYAAFYRYLEDTYGKQKLVRLLMLHNSGMHFSRALSRVYGSSDTTLYRQCSRSYRRLLAVTYSARSRDTGAKTAYGIPPLRVVREDGKTYLRTASFSRTVQAASLHDTASFLERSVFVSVQTDSFIYARQEDDGAAVVIVDAKTGDVRERIPFPFRKITTPAISNGGDRIIFAGHTTSRIDLYLYTRSSGTLTRITDNRFIERDPVFSPDGTAVAYSSNYNDEQAYDSEKVSIREIDLQTRQAFTRISHTHAALHPVYSTDGSRIYYTAVKDGEYSVCRYTRSSETVEKAHTATAGGLYPFVHGDRITYTQYDDRGEMRRIQEGGALSFTPLSVPKDSATQTVRSSLLEYSGVESSTYRSFYWKSESAGVVENTIGNSIGMRFGTVFTDEHEAVQFTADADHHTGRNLEETGFTVECLYQQRPVNALLSIARMYFPAAGSSRTMPLLTKSTAVADTALYRSAVSGFLPLSPGVIFQTGCRYDYYAGNEADAGHTVPFASLQLGTPEIDGLFSAGRFITLHAESPVRDSSIHLYGRVSYDVSLPGDLLYHLDGSLSYLHNGHNSVFYQPLGGSYLRGYPYGHAGTASAGGVISAQLYHMPCSNLSLGRIDTGPIGWGIFADYGYTPKTLSGDGMHLYDGGISLRAGKPDTYYLKLDWVLPFFYGYTGSQSILFSTGITF